MVDLNRMIQTLKRHPDSHKMGMLASHLGVVRGTSLDGRKVSGVKVSFHENIVENIINDIKNMPGIIDVMVEVSGGTLKVGDEIMAVAVGGDTREHVFPALIRAVDRIKAEGSQKSEQF